IRDVAPEVPRVAVHTANGVGWAGSNKLAKTADCLGNSTITVHGRGGKGSEGVFSVANAAFDEVNHLFRAGVLKLLKTGDRHSHSGLTDRVFRSRENLARSNVDLLVTRVRLHCGVLGVFDFLEQLRTARERLSRATAGHAVEQRIATGDV